MNKVIKLKNKFIGDGRPVYIIAEMSANHGGDFNRAKEIIHAAKEAGADCIKVQTYTADTITIDCDKEYFQIKKGTWAGENLYKLYQKAYTPWQWQAELKSEAERIGIDFLSTPFDKTAVDFLEDIGLEFYKIASFEVIDIPLIKYVASKGKPIIMSTGMATLKEIKEAVNVIKGQGNNNLCLLKCSSAYPAIPDDMNLKTINNLKEIFNIPIGLSDHSMGFIGAVTAVALGAKVIEKHFCLSREIKTPDSSFSMEPDEFKEMVKNIRLAERAIGKVNYDISPNEEVSRKHRKSIFIVKDIKKGEKFTEENIRVIRPAQGLLPKYYDDILGKYASMDIERGTPLDWDMILNNNQ
ncbi:pseudaminic acid synthase [Paramaledivibacter caminithermalis]|jgi:pseudaminic acid synthase|uniref:N-acetylneuraminate synthase n=1 Tax=Paramaledivibacter caminithermalis (strain DSM 15212 / CIP 107654 / DViRD3) TaxID=1121301 RepID=A0A1M6L707_PARC5|nr:pseudaminic acid synthase [Paramaledivibacter caminithermalis]SHJ66985.1 N-acetylneuraminate synthase [Paramaledivibacter caminithermalis DSM 15212]